MNNLDIQIIMKLLCNNCEDCRECPISKISESKDHPNCEVAFREYMKNRRAELEAKSAK